MLLGFFSSVFNFVFESGIYVNRVEGSMITAFPCFDYVFIART